MSTTTKGTAIITGASAGIGAIYADRLAERGYDRILVARNKTSLAGLAQRLRSSTGRFVDTARERGHHPPGQQQRERLGVESCRNIDAVTERSP